MDNKSYTVKEKIQLTNTKNNEKLVFDKGDSFYFVKLKNKNYKIFFLQKEEYNTILVNNETLEIILKNSYENTLVNKDNELYAIDFNFIENKKTSILVTKYLNSFQKVLKLHNLSANYDEIYDNILNIIKNLETLSIEKNHINYANLNDKQIASLDFFKDSKTNIENFKNKNVSINEKPYIYIRELENYAFSIFSEAIDYAQENQLDMVLIYLNDCVSILEISSNINNGQLQNAFFNCTYLENMVKEGLPDDFWQNWIIPSISAKNFKEQELNYFKLIKNI